MIKQYNTQLENAVREDIAPLLYQKVEQLNAHGVVDYVGFVLETLEDRIKRIDDTIKELQDAKKSINTQCDIIKVGTSEWLTENGIEKLNGDRISSISVFNKKESYELMIIDEESVINSGYFKMVVDKTSAKQAILNGLEVNGAKLELTYNEPSIKLNKKRVKDDNIDKLQ